MKTMRYEGKPRFALLGTSNGAGMLNHLVLHYRHFQRAVPMCTCLLTTQTPTQPPIPVLQVHGVAALPRLGGAWCVVGGGAARGEKHAHTRGARKITRERQSVRVGKA